MSKIPPSKKLCQNYSLTYFGCDMDCNPTWDCKTPKTCPYYQLDPIKLGFMSIIVSICLALSIGIISIPIYVISKFIGD